MKKEFLNYEQALELKELGFNEPCMSYFDSRLEQQFGNFDFTEIDSYDKSIAALSPTYSQGFRFFREKYNLHISISHSVNGKFDCWTNDGNLLENSKYCDVDTYEKAELACLNKLIEIVKK